MIKVLELIDGGFLGGGQTHILSLVKCIDKNKFDTVISASGEGEFKKQVLKNGFKFAEIEMPKIYHSRYLEELNRIITENKIEIIHSHGGVAGMYARFYNKRYDKVKVIHTIHGIHYINSPGLIKKFISLSVEQFLVPFTDRFICVSDADLETAVKNKIIDPEKTTVIKNGIDLARFSGKLKDKEITDALGIFSDDLIIGNISRFDYQKNQRFIILNADAILEKFPAVKILLAGGGKLLDECRQMAERSLYKDRIIFTNEVNDPEKYYPLLDIYVFPSLWEGLSISLIEAMASSKCILASNIPANKELIEDNQNGLIFNVYSKHEYLLKLEELITDKKLRLKLSQQAGKDSMNYSEKVMTEKIEKEYLKLIL